MSSPSHPKSSGKRSVDRITIALMNARLDLACRVFGPDPTQYERALGRQQLKRDRVVELRRYKAGRI
jgi:hypothetical protein